MNEFKPGREDAIRIDVYAIDEEILNFSFELTEVYRNKLDTAAQNKNTFEEELRSLIRTADKLHKNLNTPENISPSLISNAGRAYFEDGLQKRTLYGINSRLAKHILEAQVRFYFEQMNYLIERRREFSKEQKYLEEIANSQNNIWNRIKTLLGF